MISTAGKIYTLILLRHPQRISLFGKFVRLCSNTNKGESRSSSRGTTHFGYQEIPTEHKFNRVREVFDNVALNYDLMNDCMSAGIHRLWKQYFVWSMHSTGDTQFLDVAGGTGDIAFRFLDLSKAKYGSDQFYKYHVNVVDINASMLRVGQERAASLKISSDRIKWTLGDAEQLPIGDNSVDLYAIAFGIRNCTNIQKVVDEAFRVLKPGGKFMCLEFSQVKNATLSRLYDWYSFNIIPVIGQLVAGDWKSYQYLVESIRQFPAQEEFADLIQRTGFVNVNFKNLTSGICAIHSGFKLCS